MHTGSVKYRNTAGIFVLSVVPEGRADSDGVPMTRSQAAEVLHCINCALDRKDDGADLSEGAFCRFVQLRMPDMYLFSLNLGGILYKGYEFNRKKLKGLRASLLNAFTLADTQALPEQADG